MNKKLHLAIDVGGTNTRLIFQVMENEKVVETSDLYKKEISRLEDLKDFILTSLNKYSTKSVDHCIIGIAGNVIIGDIIPGIKHTANRVKISNWPDQPLLTSKILFSWGLPKSTKLVNDMEPAAYGILALLEDKNLLQKNTRQIYKPNEEFLKETHPKHKVILAPGTGFGTVNIINFSNGNLQIIPSEIQHISVSPIDTTHQKLIEIFKSQYKRYPSWEDFVSGKGISFIYKTLRKYFFPKHDDVTDNISANSIAGFIASNAQKNEICFATMDIFYRCVGKLAQAIALIIQPYGGIFLCGSNTSKNEEIIINSQMLKELQTNYLRQEQLKQFPVYLVKDDDINLRGALWACNFLANTTNQDIGNVDLQE